MIQKRKPKLLIIGHARHGKDTLAELIRDKMGLAFTSSSIFVGEECIWPMWGQERYPNFQIMFADRVNYRKTWADLISAYNTPDKTRTARTMLGRGYDMYVGMRRMDEFMACHEAKLFDHVIWVDRSKVLPPEGKDSNDMIPSLADLFCDNNEGMDQLELFVSLLQEMLHKEGFDVGLMDTIESPSDPLEANPTPQEQSSGLDWRDMPEGAVRVLDHGFFIVREIMGSDKSIAESARMSYGRGTKKVNSDKGLINYLVHHHHTSPLEMAEVKVHMRLPIFVMRQLVRHRTANLNEYSGRYSEMVRLFYIPEISQICHQDNVNKQGSSDPLDPEMAMTVQEVMRNTCNQAFDTYERMLDAGVSRETARIVLPLNTYTEVVWKMDVSNLIKFLMLRDDSHAQYEIRVYAKLLAETLSHFFPDVYEAYERERNCVNLTPLQIESLCRGELVEGLSKSETSQIEKIFGEFGLEFGLDFS